jgi:hypothetical protein
VPKKRTMSYMLKVYTDATACGCACKRLQPLFSTANSKGVSAALYQNVLKDKNIVM